MNRETFGRFIEWLSEEAIIWYVALCIYFFLTEMVG